MYIGFIYIYRVYISGLLYIDDPALFEASSGSGCRFVSSTKCMAPGPSAFPVCSSLH